jgi:Cu/Zn superoxide dismutase
VLQVCIGYNKLFDEHGINSTRRLQLPRHRLGNLHADSHGVASYDWTDTEMNLSLIIGRGVIIHEKADDYGQPTGNAGGRVAQGVIGVAKPDEGHDH